MKENLKKAIELANGAGSCQYRTEEGEPSCVIAQLYVLEGGDVNDLQEDCSVETLAGTSDKFCEILKDYDMTLLNRLQMEWDVLGFVDDPNEALLKYAESKLQCKI